MLSVENNNYTITFDDVMWLKWVSLKYKLTHFPRQIKKLHENFHL